MLALGSPALARPDIDPAAAPAAVITRTLDQDTLQFDLPFLRTVRPDLMIPRLTFAVGRPMMPSGQTRGESVPAAAAVACRRRGSRRQHPADGRR